MWIVELLFDDMWVTVGIGYQDIEAARAAVDIWRQKYDCRSCLPFRYSFVIEAEPEDATILPF